MKVASYRYVGGPVRQRNHLTKVASRSLALSESVSLNRPDYRAVTNSGSVTPGLEKVM